LVHSAALFLEDYHVDELTPQPPFEQPSHQKKRQNLTRFIPKFKQVLLQFKQMPLHCQKQKYSLCVQKIKPELISCRVEGRSISPEAHEMFKRSDWRAVNHMSETLTSTHLDNGFWGLDGGVEASSTQGILHLDQWGVGQVDLSPEAQYDLLRILYARRGILYRSTTLDTKGQYAPDWVATDPIIEEIRQSTTVEGSVAVDPSEDQGNGDSAGY
jgi:hypothetical protein